MQQFTLFVLWLSLKTDMTAKLESPGGNSLVSTVYRMP